MKVLYIGVYRDSTGWGRAAIDYILSLDAAGVDVVPRPIKLNNNKFPVPKRIAELEEKSSNGCDVVIQHVLPHMMEYHGCFKKNIGLFVNETSHFKNSGWAEKLNLMDEVWVANRGQVPACCDSNVERMIRVVPHATDITRFQRGYEPIPDLKKNIEDTFSFYFIGELVVRKNLPALLKAFHLEFDTNEPVSLVIKTSKTGQSPMEVANRIHSITTEVKQGLKLYPNLNDYHKEHVLPNHFSDEAIMRLHATCDCFVMPSYGEAWCIPAFDAMALGKTPIVTCCCGLVDYINSNVGWVVGGQKEPVFGVTDSFNNLFVGNEEWTNISIIDLRKAMRKAYEDKEERTRKSINGMSRAYNFSYEKIGSLMRCLLNEEKV